MILKLKSFTIALILITLLFFGIQYFIVETIKEKQEVFYFSTWSIYLFHFLVTFFTYVFVLFVNITFPDKTGYAFMSSSILKMMGAFLFLLPLILDKEKAGVNDVFAFFIPYFLFLFFEVVYVVKILNKK